MMLRKLVLGATVAALSASASAQDEGALVLYSKGHFEGFSQVINGPRTNMSPLEVKSMKIPPGTTWDLCSGNTFSGCARFTASKEAMVRTVRSVRPVAPAIPETAQGAGTGPVAGAGPSLKGLASEFFVVPALDGNRIEVVGNAAGAASGAATEFCRVHGWRMSVYERVQTVGGRTFLADVLCVNEDR
jgi:hypothetical protein